MVVGQVGQLRPAVGVHEYIYEALLPAEPIVALSKYIQIVALGPAETLAIGSTVMVTESILRLPALSTTVIVYVVVALTFTCGLESEGLFIFVLGAHVIVEGPVPPVTQGCPPKITLSPLHTVCGEPGSITRGVPAKAFTPKKRLNKNPNMICVFLCGTMSFVRKSAKII